MSVIDKLTVTENNRNDNATRQGRLRMRLIENLHEQIAAAEAMVKGEPFRKYRDRMITNPETGEKEVKKMVVCHRPWFWRDADGTYFVGLRYSNRWLELMPGKSAVEVGKVEELPTVLRKLLEAVNAGELDAVLTKAAGERRAQFTSRKTSKPKLVKN